MEQPLAFDVGNASSQSFGVLMGQTDAFFMHRSIIQYHGVPLTLNTVGWLPISLRLNEDSIDLAIDAKDGYLSAVREGGGGGAQQDLPWYYFSDCNPSGLAGPKRKLSSKSSYGALVKGNLASSIMVGKEALVDCFHRILGFLRANRHREDNTIPEDGLKLTDDEARALARIIAMICEPSRLRSPREFVSSCMDSWVNQRLNSKLIMKIKNWSHISRFAIHCLGKAILSSKELYDEDELKLVKHLLIFSLEQTVGPHGELLLIRCREYQKEKLDFSRG